MRVGAGARAGERAGAGAGAGSGVCAGAEGLTLAEVTSPSMRRAKTTVKKGAEALMVSVKETATYLSETRPSITVATRIRPTSDMHARNCEGDCVESGVGCAGPKPVSHGPYILAAPKAAVIVIWLTASTFGSALSVESMCLLPKRVQPLNPNQSVMKTTILACTLACWIDLRLSATSCLGPEPFSASRDGLTVLAGEASRVGALVLTPIRASSREPRGVRSARPDSGDSCEPRGERISREDDPDPPSLGSIAWLAVTRNKASERVLPPRD